MTDRIRTLTVVLDHDIRDDDVQVVVEAIKMIRCVGSVHLGEPVRGEDWINRESIRLEVMGDIIKSVREILSPWETRDGKG